MPQAMHIYRANRVETLLDALAETLAPPLASPLAAECVVVQSKGMATWLAMRLSRRFSVWANPDFPHPRQFIQRILRATMGEEKGDLVRRYSRERLGFALCALLADLGDEPVFTPLTAYLRQSPQGGKLQLAAKIADLFDQYLIYRSEMILAWENGADTPGSARGDDLWQPLLWRRLQAHLGCCSPARLMLDAGQVLASGGLPFPALLPERVSLFGIDSLPPVYLGLFAALARLIPVHFFLFSPAEGYFAQIASKAEANRLLAKATPGLARDDFHLDTGHPLLASLGIMARDFQEILEDCPALIESEKYAPHQEQGSMLEALQNDILELRHRSPADAEAARSLPLAGNDASITLHSCCGRLREVEALQDQLLALLAGLPGLEPGEILVMIPDVAAYAPLIQAVFGLPVEDRRFIPYRIADRPLLGASRLIDLFFRFLEMAPGRMPASWLLELLGCEEVRLNHGISLDELPKIKLWVEQSGIRWGLDEEHRAACGQPYNRQNTWRFGFDRLALGYAFRVEDTEDVFLGDVLPFAGIEGQAAGPAGRFMAFCEAVFAVAAELALSRAVPEWQAVVNRLLAVLFAADSPQAWQAQKIRDSLAEVALEADEAGFAGTIDLKDLTMLLKGKLGEPATAQGFLEGGLTFCGMLPMRSIPFRVICLLGMNDGEFPRVEYPQSFDLLARYPKKGDRAKRNDDRYVFLEALLCARERLLIFYQGGSLGEGKPLPPSVVVEELVDCLADSFMVPESFLGGMPHSKDTEEVRREAILKRIMIPHPLQPFSRRYFAGQERGLFSFAAEYCRAAQAREAGLRPFPNFCPAHLPPLAVEQTAIALSELCRCLAHPARWFFENRLGLFLREKNRFVQDREPIHLDKLAEYQLRQELFLLKEEGLRHPEALLARWQGEGRLPLGQAAQTAFAAISAAARPIAEELVRHAEGEALPPLIRELHLAQGLTLRGELGARYPGGRLCLSGSRVHGRMLIPVWVEHLFLCAAAPGDQTLVTSLICRGKEKNSVLVLKLSPVNEAADLLVELARLFVEAFTSPLPFLPKSSFAFARAMRTGKTTGQGLLVAALARAEAEYRGDDYSLGEGEDPYLRQLYGSDLPSARDEGGFTGLSLKVFLPLLDHLEGL